MIEKDIEVKFRGKKVDTGEWVYGYLFIDKSSDIDRYFLIAEKAEYCDITEFIDGTEGRIVEVIPETVGQYTGLKDKNGKEIYKGDIVKAEGLISIRVRPVIFKNGMFCIVGESALLPLDEYVGKGNELEVIGNIYDNPELLEK